MAAGELSPTKIGGLLGRPATSLTHQLASLASAGFIERRHDLLAAGFTDDLAAEAAASRGKILLATVKELYGQSS